MRVRLIAILLALAALALPVTSYAEDDSTLQMRLANDPDFIARVEYNLLKVVWNVLGEATNTPRNAERVAKAKQFRGDPSLWATRVTRWLANRGNIIAATTTPKPGGGASSSVTDAALFSQITSDFNLWLD